MRSLFEKISRNSAIQFYISQKSLDSLLFLIPLNVFRELSMARKRVTEILARESERRRRRECRVSNLARIYGTLCKAAFLNSPKIYLKILFLLSILFPYLLLRCSFTFFILYKTQRTQKVPFGQLYICVSVSIDLLNFYVTNFFLFYSRKKWSLPSRVKKEREFSIEYRP